LAVFDVQKEPGPLDPEFLAKNHLSFLLVVPLIANDEVLGMSSFYSRDKHEFNAEEVEFLMTLAGQASIAIYNSTMYGNLQSQAETLKRSNQVKSEFLGIMSHELTTPITVMMGYATLIEEEVVGSASEEQKAAIRVIRRKGGDLLSMIRGILEATKLESGDIEVEKTEVDLAELLRELEAETIVPPGKNVSVNWSYDRLLPLLRTDSAKLKQTLVHLIDNGVKFTPEGLVGISAKYDSENQRITLDVADTGVGISAEMHSVIFEKFRQVDSSDTRSFEGIGLGLFIVKRNIELLGGEIIVKSDCGKGSTFTLTLPCDMACVAANSAVPELPSRLQSVYPL
jgi:Amt family ammonium transporter